jgi:hypothetical protein
MMIVLYGGNMVDIFDALKQLKTTLEEINGQPMVESREGLADTTKSQQLFINRTILSPKLAIPHEFASTKQGDDYANHTLQAVWNLAHYASKGYISAWRNREISKEAVNYLDECRVLKIIDEKTYKIGKALQVFLEVALTEEALNKIPFNIVRTNTKKMLSEMQSILNHRLTVYEIHKPEYIANVHRMIGLVKDRRLEWETAHDSFSQKIAALHLLDNWNMFQFPLSSDTASLENKLKALEAQLAHHEQAIQVFHDFLEQWHNKNLQEDLPESIFISTYIQLMEDDPNPSIMVELAKIYNVEHYLVWPEEIGDALNTIYASSITDLKNTEEDIKQTLALQKNMLHIRLNDATLLAELEQKIGSTFNLIPELVIPEDIRLFINNPNRFSSNDMEFYEKLISAIIPYQEELLKSRQQLNKQLDLFDEEYSLPKIEDEEHQSVFKQVIEETKQRLKNKSNDVEEKTDIIKNLLQQLSSTVRHLKDELVKQTEQGREDQLEQATANVHLTLTQMEGVIPNVINEELQLKQFTVSVTNAIEEIHHRFFPQIMALNRAIGETQEQVSSKTILLANIEKQIDKRQNFLKLARSELSHFHHILMDYSGIYLPVNKIPKEELNTYLEANDKVRSYIDDIYSLEQTGKQWFGFNLSNLSNQYRHYASLFGPSEFDLDRNSLLEYIEEKIGLIDTELKIDLKSDVPPPLSSKYTLSDQNLWNLHQNYKQILQEKNALDAIRLEQEHVLHDINKKKTTELDEWEKKRSQIEQSFIHLNLEHNLNTLAYHQAQLTLSSYELEYKVADMGKEQNELTKIMEFVDSLDTNAALVYLEQTQERILALDFDAQMNLKIEGRSNSERENQVEELLSGQIKDLAKVTLLEQTLVETPRQLIKKMTELTEGKIVLEEKHVRLKYSLNRIKKANQENMIVLNQKKEQLIILQKLGLFTDELNAHYLELQGMPANKDVRQQLIKQMVQFKTTELSSVIPFKNHPDKIVNEKYIEVRDLINNFEDQLIKFQLDGVKEEANLLIKRFSTKDKNDKNGLLAAILKFTPGAVGFLNIHKDSSNKEIQQKINAISADLAQIEVIQNILEPLSGTSKKLFIDHIEPSTKDEEHSQQALSRKHIINAKYWGNSSQIGIFSDYLKERAQTFWFKDFLREFAALALGCFGYKTDSQERKEYIDELKTKFNQYQKNDDTNDDELIKFIDKGQKKFAPRCKPGQEGYNNSLHGKLELLRKDLLSIRLEHDDLPRCIIK